MPWPAGLIDCLVMSPDTSDLLLGVPSNWVRFRKRCTSAAASFTQVKCVGEALKQNAG